MQRLDLGHGTHEHELDRLTQQTALAFGTPIAAVTLLGRKRMFVIAITGLRLSSVALESAFCSRVMATSEVMVVRDTRFDLRFDKNRFVLTPPHIRFYAGAPLITNAGCALGTLCIVDQRPRVFDADQCSLLQYLARKVVTVLEHRIKAGS